MFSRSKTNTDKDFNLQFDGLSVYALGNREALKTTFLKTNVTNSEWPAEVLHLSPKIGF